MLHLPHFINEYTRGRRPQVPDSVMVTILNQAAEKKTRACAIGISASTGSASFTGSEAEARALARSDPGRPAARHENPFTAGSALKMDFSSRSYSIPNHDAAFLLSSPPSRLSPPHVSTVTRSNQRAFPTCKYLTSTTDKRHRI